MVRGLIVYSALAVLMSVGAARAQPSQSQFETLERRVISLESQVGGLASSVLVVFLFGAFCALWAQDSGRQPLVWFFLGLSTNVFAVLILLTKNSADKKLAAIPKAPLRLD